MQDTPHVIISDDNEEDDLDMINLLDETLSKLADLGYARADVDFVTDGEASCSFDEFAETARGVDYDNGYGVAAVNTRLRIALSDGTWLERAEYDGSEWWRQVRRPEMRERGRVRIMEDVF